MPTPKPRNTVQLVILTLTALALCWGCSPAAKYTEPLAPTSELQKAEAECRAYAAANSAVVVSDTAWIANSYLSSQRKKELFEACMEARGYVKEREAE